ncbi:uncharacterized protein ATC70_003835 [Mucor velutinosus]|uniref:DUF3020 domain-containing protein n=1 Tax=Mucor velutinosus TaxID=708070 RepID=A0AAN7HXW2_9FUNG|nr:hypothetical protein ATC70_003835 [Mucor velutinosus]
MDNTHIKTEEPSVTSQNETATVAATSSNDNTIAVTSSSPTSTTSAFQPYQQLHEAVLAAVNSNTSLSNSLFSAAVAAAAANSNVPIHSHTPQLQPLDQPHQQTIQNPPTARRINQEMDQAKKESVRASNRERKKKWRIHNEERNKDNDLRCRVNKRANKLYGSQDSPAKQQWVQEEFEKRRQKRMDKERRKHLVNNVLSVPNATNPEAHHGVSTEDNHNTDGNNNNNDANTVSMLNSVNANQMQNFYTPLPQIDTATAAKLLDFPTDLQRQLLEQLNNSMMALTNGIQPPPTDQGNEDNNNADASGSADMVYDNQQAAAVAAANEALQQVIAQGLSTNTTSATSSGHNSPMQYTATTATTNDLMETDEVKAEPAEVPAEGPEVKAESTEEDKVKDENGEEKKPEYPMDAVLTLMQLNAGWRQ